MPNYTISVNLLKRLGKIRVNMGQLLEIAWNKTDDDDDDDDDDKSQ